LFEIRDEVLRALEEARIAKRIGSSLEASVELKSDSTTYEFLKSYEDQLRYLFIVSEVKLTKGEGIIAHDGRSGLSGVSEIAITRAEGQKCERCWNYSTHVGESERYPTVCERCVAALEEIEREEA